MSDVCEVCGRPGGLYLPDGPASAVYLCPLHEKHALADRAAGEQQARTRARARRVDKDAQLGLDVDAGTGGFLEPAERRAGGRRQEPLIDRIRRGQQ